eukprot:TRINITY_DN10506_c0_g1_i1.p1 TRINITY_DN10506_c0_g1~~TRINITY_DN10506_c0_g1_i1.p1  ORF type:complete len:204 (-),score=61.22 TRINITY_DN10506_c0_g1_i1:53-664(-)
MAMFGLIVSGRLVSTNWEEISPTNCVAEIPDADTVNHVVIFLTGAVPFPEGMGGAVYFCWPQPGGGQVWQLLGTISNTKPSAIFRISKLKAADENENMTNSFMSLGSGMPTRLNAMVGISVEPLVTIEGQTPAAQTEAATVSNFMEFSQKMVENLFNYATSFAVSAGDMRARPGETFVPFSSLQQWYTNFERRLQQNPNFWRK